MINYYFKMYEYFPGFPIRRARVDDSMALYRLHLHAVQNADYIWMEEDGKVTYLKNRYGDDTASVDAIEFAEIKLSAVEL